MYDLIIIGGGPAAMSAALYAHRFKLNVLVIAKKIGGTATEAWVIDNYLGIKHIMGNDLAMKFVDHVKSLDIKIIEEEVKNIEKGKNFIVKTGKQKFESKTLVFASGTHRRKLDVKGEEKFTNKGVVYCSYCDAPMFRNKEVVVVGSGDSGINSALLLTEYAKKIYVIASSEVKAAPRYLEIAKKNKKIEFLTNTKVKEIKGDIFVNSIVIEEKGKEKILNVQGVFVEKGSEPNNELAKQLKIKLDKEGNIEIDENMQTNVKGIFAAGDITTSGGKFRQVITSAAEGAKAGYGVYRFLKI